MTEQPQSSSSSAPLNEDHIRYHMAQELRSTVDKNKEMEGILSQESQKNKQLEDYIKKLEQSLNIYQDKDKQRLRRRYEERIIPATRGLEQFCPDNETKEFVKDYQRHLMEKIDKQPYEPEVAKTLEKEVAFVETVCSAYQIQSSKYEEFLKREQDLRKLLEEKDQMIKKFETDLSSTQNQSQQQIAAKEEEMKKVREELEKMKQELEKTSTTIKNTEKHLEQQQQLEPQEEEETSALEQPDPPRAPMTNNVTSAPLVHTVAGAEGTGRASDMYNLARPRTDWRNISTNVTQKMYSDRIRQTYSANKPTHSLY